MNAPAFRSASRILAATFLAACPALAPAGGPNFIDSDGTPFLWSTAQPIRYWTDGGNLSAGIANAAAQARVRELFDAWQDVPTSSIRYQRVGQIPAVTGFSDGDVSTAAEFDAVEGACFDGDQSPIVFDVNGSMFEDLGQDASVIGFAGPCAGNAQGEIISGRAAMNGIYLDGVTTADNPELPPDGFDAAFIHEFGHFSGLDHSQINVNCINGCGADDLAGLPTMFPFLMAVEQKSLSTDDVAWISWLYPQSGASGFNATHGVIRGVVYFSDGESQAQFVNVIARRVDAGGNEDRRIAASSVSGYRFSLLHGNSITGGSPSGAGSENPAHIGLYEIPVPAGSYTVEVEAIDEEFTQGSSVGPGLVPPLPGDAPAPLGPFAVTAGQSSNGHDIVLLNTPPRYDDFETDP